MATKKPMVDESGNTVVTLFDGTQVAIRQPKGRDLSAIELATQTAQTNLEVMVFILGELIVSPVLTADQLWDMDAADLQTLGETLHSFRVFSKPQG